MQCFIIKKLRKRNIRCFFRFLTSKRVCTCNSTESAICKNKELAKTMTPSTSHYLENFPPKCSLYATFIHPAHSLRCWHCYVLFMFKIRLRAQFYACIVALSCGSTNNGDLRWQKRERINLSCFGKSAAPLGGGGIIEF